MNAGKANRQTDDTVTKETTRMSLLYRWKGGTFSQQPTGFQGHYIATEGADVSRATNPTSSSKAGTSSPRKGRSLGRLVVLTCAALMLLGIFGASPGSAAPIFTGSFPNTFALTTSGSILFAGAGEVGVNCKGKEVVGSGSLTSATGGTFAAEMGCKLDGEPCEASGGGKPKFEGSFELVQIDPTTIGVVFLPKELSFFCAATKGPHTIKYRGAVVGTISPINESTKTLTVTFATTGSVNLYHECEVGFQCGKKLQIEGSIDGGPYSVGELVSSPILNTAAATKIVK